MTDPKTFIKIWNESKSVAEVASKLGVKKHTAQHTATSLRALGYDVPIKQRGNPQWQKKK